MTNMEDSLDMPLRQVIPLIQARIMKQSQYFGIPAQKFPPDFWTYQEIIWETRPDLIIEIGNNRGGSTLALAHLCDAMGSGRILGVDITHELVPDLVRNHPRISLVTGDACSVLTEIKKRVSTSTVMIIEDSSHTYDNTLNVLRTYAPLVTPGHYFIVEDGICWHGLDRGPKPGPYEAVEQFLSETHDFVLDRSKESFLLTWNPKGYLRRI